jgi:outer membrane receptor protein involved in Fe transport
MPRIGTLVATAALLCGLPTYAGDPSSSEATGASGDGLTDLSLAELLSVPVVTASGGVEEDSSLSSAQVMIYTRSEIARRQWRSLADVLANVPGLYVIDDLVTSAVTVRGASGGVKSGTRIIKVMINGIEVNFRPDMTAFLGPEYIPMNVVERVEIAKGPLSALYGSNAFLATVNVITRVPLTDLHAQLGVQGEMLGRRGYGGWATLTYASERFSLLAAAYGANMDRSGLRVPMTFPTQDPALPQFSQFFNSESKNDQSSPRSLYGTMHLSLEKFGGLTFQGGLQQLDSNGEFQLGTPLTHEARYALTNLWSHLKYEVSFSEAVSAWASIGYSSGAPTRDDVQFLNVLKQYEFHRQLGYHAIDGGAGVSWKVLSWLRAAADVSYTWEKHRALSYTQVYRTEEPPNLAGDSMSNVPEGSITYPIINNVAAHVSLAASNFSKLPNLHLSTDVRVDVPNLFPAEPSWRATIAYKWTEGFTTRAVVGRAFQSPSAVLMFAIPNFGNSNNIVGNRTATNQIPLVPQTVLSGELIANIRMAQTLEVVPSVWIQQLDQSIDFVSNGPGYLARNGVTRKSVGAELTSRFELGRLKPQVAAAFQWPLANGNTTVVDPTEKLSAPPQFPRIWVMGNLGVDVPEAYLKLNATVKYVGERGPTEQNLRLNNDHPYALPAYFTADVVISSMGLSLLAPHETWLSLAVRNVTDERHAEPGPVGMDLPTLGRSVQLEVRQVF